MMQVLLAIFVAGLGFYLAHRIVHYNQGTTA